jgi:uncharacterized membrane protein YccC
MCLLYQVHLMFATEQLIFLNRTDQGACKMKKEDDLRDALSRTANDMAQLEGNPRTWLSWMVYLLARLEEQTTTSRADKESFLEMLSALQDEIKNRIRTGGWN